MDYQIDTMAINIMFRLLRSVVPYLMKKISRDNNQKQWYEIYLTFFVLLNTLEIVHEVQLGYMDLNKDMVYI